MFSGLMDLIMFGVSHSELNVILQRFSHLLFQRFASLLNRSYGNCTYHRRETSAIQDPFVTLHCKNVLFDVARS